MTKLRIKPAAHPPPVDDPDRVPGTFDVYVVCCRKGCGALTARGPGTVLCTRCRRVSRETLHTVAARLRAGGAS